MKLSRYQKFLQACAKDRAKMKELVEKYPEKTLSEIGKMVGGKSRQSVYNAIGPTGRQADKKGKKNAASTRKNGVVSLQGTDDPGS